VRKAKLFAEYVGTAGFGAVPDVSYPYVVVSTTKEVGFEFDVFESSMRYDIDKVSFSVGELRNEDGYVVPSGIFKFTGYDGKTLVKQWKREWA